MADPWIDAEWIRVRLHESGRTQRELAKALSVDASAISRLLDGRRQLKAHEIPIVVEFFSSAATVTGNVAATPNPPVEAAPQTARARPGPSQARQRTTSTTEMPVYGPLTRGTDDEYFLEGIAGEYRPRPPQLSGVAGAFALFLPDDELAPRYRAGEVIYVHPSKPPLSGTYVVIRLRGPSKQVFIGEISEIALNSVEIRTARGRLRTIAKQDIGQIGRIVVSATE